MATVLTTASVERTKPNATKRLELPDAVLPGLYLVIQPSGVKSWAIRYRHAGKPRKLTLGPYPALDLAAARSRGREALQIVALGRDPGSEKLAAARKSRESAADEDLVGGAVAAFIARHVKPNTAARSAEETIRIFDKHVLPCWRKKRLDEIRRADVIALLDRVVDGGAPVAANRTLAAVRKFFNWCVDRGQLESSPCLRVTAPTAEVSRDRVLSDDELRLAWLATETMGAPFGPFIRILMLTAQRRDEVAKMVRAEIGNGNVWVIPSARTKNGVANDVPLSCAAQREFKALPRIAGSELLFTTSGETAISGFAKAKARLDREMLKLARKEATDRGEDPDQTEIPPWRIHDLRRTAASGMARLGTTVHVIEAILNHRSGAISGVAAIYNRHKYLDEKRAALELWGKHVENLVDGRS